MACRLIFVKFENVSGGAAGYYDLVDSQNRVLFENLSSSQLETGMTFSVDNQEIQFRLTNFRLDGDSNPCQTSTSTTTSTTTNAVVTSGLLMWVDADNETSYPGNTGSTWFDLSGNGRNVDLVNSPIYRTDKPSIGFNDGVYDQYGTFSAIWPLTSWTLEVWSRETESNLGKNAAIVTNQFSGVYQPNGAITAALGYLFQANSGIQIGYNNNSWEVSNQFQLSEDAFYHIVGSFDGSNLSLIINGVTQSYTQHVVNIDRGGDVYHVARRWDQDLSSNNLYSGDIAIIRMYDRALSYNEVMQNYDYEISRYSSTSTTTSTTTTGGVYTFNNVGYESGPCDAKDSSNRTVYSSCSTIQAGCVIYENDSLTTPLTGNIVIYIQSQSQIFDINPSTGVIIGLASSQC